MKNQTIYIGDKSSRIISWVKCLNYNNGIHCIYENTETYSISQGLLFDCSLRIHKDYV